MKRCPRYQVRLVRNGSSPYLIGDGRDNRILGTIDAKRIVADIVRSTMEDSGHEMLGVITLDTKNKPIGFQIVTEGTLNSSLTHPREIFQCAILQNAHSIMLVHNHPSGDLTPSESDRIVTKRIRDAGEIIGIPLLDHIIVGMHPDTGEWMSLSIEEY